MRRFILLFRFLAFSFVYTLFLPTSVVVFASNTLAGCAGFPDVSFASEFCQSITYAKRKEILTGQGSGEYKPDANLTRAEAAAVLVRYLDVDLPTSYPLLARFPDASLREWYAPYFEVLLQRNIFEGYPDGTLRPGSTLARSEWLKLWYVAQNNTPSRSVDPTVLDIPNRSDHDWYRFFVYDAIKNNYIDLRSGYFFPADGQKRKLVADLVYKYDKVHDSLFVDPTTNDVDLSQDAGEVSVTTGGEANKLFTVLDSNLVLGQELGVQTDSDGELPDKVIDFSTFDLNNPRVFYQNFLKVFTDEHTLIGFENLDLFVTASGKRLSYFALEMLLDLFVVDYQVVTETSEYLAVEMNGKAYWFRYSADFSWQELFSSSELRDFVGVDFYGNEVFSIDDADVIWR